MKNAFYFTSKVFFVLKMFKLLSWLFGHVAKRLGKKDQISFRFYYITAWLKNNCNTHISQYLEKYRQSHNDIWSVNRMQREKHFCWKIIRKMWRRKGSQTFFEKLKLLKLYTVCFYCMPRWGLSKFIKTKLQTTCFYLILSFFRK